MRALGIGELVWDLLPSSPRLGGAPFNVVAHLARLGCDAALFSAVGRDELGARTLDEVRRLNVSASFIQIVAVPTGVVRVQLDPHGMPDYEDGCGRSRPAAIEAAVAHIGRADSPL